MAVTFQGVSIVKPAEQTWEGLPNSLSKCAEIDIITHSSTINFHRPSQKWLTSGTIAILLKQSLAQALVHFYPLAGSTSTVWELSSSKPSMFEWAGLARGEPLQMIIQLPKQKWLSALAMLRLSRDEVEKLKKMANEGRESSVTTNDHDQVEALVSGHVWRCALKAKNNKPQQFDIISLLPRFTLRRRMPPPLPKGYFGGVAMSDMTATGIFGELVTKPLGYATSGIREAVEKVSSTD